MYRAKKPTRFFHQCATRNLDVTRNPPILAPNLAPTPLDQRHVGASRACAPKTPPKSSGRGFLGSRLRLTLLLLKHLSHRARALDSELLDLFLWRSCEGVEQLRELVHLARTK